MSSNQRHTPISHFQEESPYVFKLLVSSVRDYAIFLLDTQGYVRTWNAGAQKTKRYTPEEIIGKHFSIFYTPEDRMAELPAKLLQVALENGRVEDEGWRVKKDGTRFWADVVLTTIYNDRGEHIGFGKVTRDLTEKRHLVKEREEAIQASSAKSAFLANMSHELRTPLTTILGYAEMLDEQAEELDAESLREQVSKIMFSGRHLLSVVSDILDLSKIEAGRLELHYSEIDVYELLMEVAENIAPVAECNGNTMAVNAAPDLPPIFADRTRLRQIFYNLFANAAKFTRNGNIAATCSVVADVRVPQVSIAISDTGIGMPPEETDRIFDRFRQVESHEHLRQGGTGLGLAICKMLCEAMNGSISVTSEAGKGSTFEVRLPVSDPR